MSDERYRDATSFFPDNIKPRLKPDELWLGQRIAQTPEGHWCIQQPNESWQVYRNHGAAQRNAVQNWAGAASGRLSISDKDIDQFMDERAPVVRGLMIVPTSKAPAIVFRDALYINSWTGGVMVPNPDAANDLLLRQPLTLFMRVLYEGLCGKPGVKSLDEMIAIAQGKDENEIEWRFLMSWLAKLVQSPGYNMQTNVWLLGELQGVGKGILTDVILPRILGEHHCVTLNPDEVEKGGWTDALANKLLVVIDELNTNNGHFDWGSFIKKNSTSGLLTIRKRGCDSYTALNFSNSIYTSNLEMPTCIDPFDRRNALLQTTTLPEKRELALELWQWICHAQEHCPQDFTNMLGGFVHILHKHPVDSKLIAFAPDTMLKRDVQQASRKLTGLHWLQNDDDYPRDEWLPAHELAAHYNRFCGGKYPADAVAMGRILSTLARHGHIERDQPYKTKAARYSIPREKFPTWADEARQKPTSATNVLALVPMQRRTP